MSQSAGKWLLKNPAYSPAGELRAPPYAVRKYRDARWRVKRALTALFWHGRYARLREPKRESLSPHDPAIQGVIKEELKRNGFDVRDWRIDPAEYREYLKRAGYHEFSGYLAGGTSSNFTEKSLEHFLAAKLLNLSPDDVYIDIANDNSPTPEIYEKVYGCRTYRQDLWFPAGIRGNIIGSDAGHLPVESGFATKMALHCSFEHFEGESDMAFMKEAGRVLRADGRFCIVPLYLFNRYVIQTDPMVLPRAGLPFESDALLYCARNWGNRHGRFYDVPHLITRIRNNLDWARLTIYFIENEKAIAPSCYVKFAALIEKK